MHFAVVSEPDSADQVDEVLGEGVELNILGIEFEQAGDDIGGVSLRNVTQNRLKQSPVLCIVRGEVPA